MTGKYSEDLCQGCTCIWMLLNKPCVDIVLLEQNTQPVGRQVWRTKCQNKSYKLQFPRQTSSRFTLSNAKNENLACSCQLGSLVTSNFSLRFVAVHCQRLATCLLMLHLGACIKAFISVIINKVHRAACQHPQTPSAQTAESDQVRIYQRTHRRLLISSRKAACDEDMICPVEHISFKTSSEKKRENVVFLRWLCEVWAQCSSYPLTPAAQSHSRKVSGGSAARLCYACFSLVMQVVVWCGAL